MTGEMRIKMSDETLEAEYHKVFHVFENGER